MIFFFKFIHIKITMFIKRFDIYVTFYVIYIYIYYIWLYVLTYFDR